MDWLRVITPSAWLQLHPTSMEWDKRLNYLLDNHDIKLGYLTIDIGGVEIWASNYPYAYGSAHDGSSFRNVLPTVKTRKRLKKLVDQTSIKEFDKKYNILIKAIRNDYVG